MLALHRDRTVRTMAAGVLVASVAAAWVLHTRRRDAAEERACRHGISFMAFALGYYLQESGRIRMPPPTAPGDGYYWVKPILGADAGVEGQPNWFGMAPMVVQCPTMVRRPRWEAGPRVTAWGRGPGQTIHYMWNSWIAGRRMLELPEHTTILAFDCAPVHRGGRNCCFLDGHVKWLREDDFRRALRAGSNGPGPPGEPPAHPCTPLFPPHHRTLYAADSRYGRLEVTEAGGTRYLFVDGIPQTALYADRARITRQCHLFAERYWLELLPYLRPDARRCLLVGLGGGLLPAVLEGYGIETEPVEIDPKVLRAAREYFGYRGKAAVSDGRVFLKRSRQQYDLVVLDAFKGAALPPHLISRECFSLAKAHLSPGGVVAVNVIGRPEGDAVDAVSATLKDVFAHVATYRTEEPWVAQSVILFASDGSLQPKLHPHGRRLHVRAEDLPKAEEYRAYPSGSTVLTDDHCPISYEWSREASEWRRRVVDLFGHRRE